MHCGGHIYLASDRSEVGERLVLPLADDSGAIRHVIGASVYRMELKAGEGPITREKMIKHVYAAGDDRECDGSVNAERPPLLQETWIGDVRPSTGSG